LLACLLAAAAAAAGQTSNGTCPISARSKF
jgi:hypothetical protein